MKFLDRILALLKKPSKGTFLKETVGFGRAKITVQQRRPTRWLDPETPDPTSYVDVGPPVEAENLVTNSGRDFLHQQIYTRAGVSSQGLQFIALSNDTLGETVASTTLSSEIAANGLSRAVATTITHTASTNTTTLAKTFQCTTAPQAAQKAALFNQSSGGTMNHVLAFTQRSLQVGDQLTVSFVITLG
jgi:hypothetical protein